MQRASASRICHRQSKCLPKTWNESWEQVGLAIQAEPSQFHQLKLPTLAHLTSGHYVVLYELTPDGVVIGDPAAGIIRLSRGLFEQQCSGRLLLLHPPGSGRRSGKGSA